MKDLEFTENNFLEEQLEYFDNFIKLNLSPEFKLKSADKLISKLKIELGSDKSYIQELEYLIDKLKLEIKNLNLDNSKLEKELDKIKGQYKYILNKYSHDKLQVLYDDPIYTKQLNTIKKLELENQKLRLIRDELIIKLNNYDKN